MIQKIRSFSNWPIPVKIVLSFVIVMILGSFLLAMPISQLDSSKATYFDHLFGAVSMVSVTGLYTQPIAYTYNIFGQIIALLLIKLGGLGLITIVSAVVLQFGRRVGLREEITLQQALNRSSRSDFRQFIVSIVKYTLLVEAIGALLLMIHFIPSFGLFNGIFTSIFLSVSAFNNAGFDNLGVSSLQAYVDNPLINSVLPILIILGGIGFSVWFDIARNFKQFLSTRSWIDFKGTYRKLKLHTRLVLEWSFWLTFIAMILFILTEWNNVGTIGDLSFFGKMQASFFQAVSLRSAGFGTVQFTEVQAITLIIFTVFMFIGASPGGTASGAKTSTVALVVKLISAEIKGDSNINYKNHTLKTDIVKRALVIVVMFVLLIFVMFALLTLFEGEASANYLFFKSFSAFGSGLSVNLTPTFSRTSQTFMMFSMIVGRLGPITIFTALANRNKTRKEITYATGEILIG